MNKMKYIFSMFLSLLVLANCAKLDKTIIVETNNVIAPTIKSMNKIIINDNNKEEDVTFTWTAADFGKQVAVNYSVYAVNPLEDGFSYLLFTGINDLQYTTTKDALNLRLAGPKEDGYMGLPENQESDVVFYVTATLGSNSFSVPSSNNITVRVKTGVAVKPKVLLYIPGNHQGWAPANAQGIEQVKDNDGLFKGFIDLHTDGDIETQFKYTSAPDWDHTNYGGQLSPLDTDASASNLLTPSGFYYTVVNTETLEATLELAVPGLIGDFNGWGADFPMDYVYSSTREEKGYYAELDLKAGEGFKIRFNGGWSLNLGADASDEPATIPEEGMNLVEGGKNMTVAEDGKYKVSFLFDYENYVYILKCEKL